MVEEALPIFRELGDDAGVARCLWAIGSALHMEPRLDEAVAALDEAIPLFRKLGETFSLGWALHTRAVIAVRVGDPDGADRYVREGLEIFSAAGDLSGLTLLLDDAAAVADLGGDESRAIRLAGAAAAHQATIGAGVGTIVGVEEGRNWKQLISTDEHRRAWAEGEAMSLEQAVAFALTAPEAARENEA